MQEIPIKSGLNSLRYLINIGSITSSIVKFLSDSLLIASLTNSLTNSLGSELYGIASVLKFKINSVVVETENWGLQTSFVV